ncbi:MAG TPA: hypothetical protein VF173_13585, partial [Thermoanaerobaculia bacterium]|nr:hypothetical protein [Thermoanaerobaculia bacterium]
QLEAASDFQEGMLQVAAEDTARAAAVRTQIGLLASLALLSRGRRLALAGALLLLAALPVGLLVANRGLQRQLQQTQTTPAANPALDQQIAKLEAQLQSLQQSDARNRQLLEEELAKERQIRAATEKGTAAGPQVNLPLFMLAAVRSGEEAGREPVNRIPLAATTPSVIFTLELATIDYSTYRATLHDASGKELWQARGLRPDSRDSLVILLPSPMLPPGVYQLTIEGMKSGGPGFAVGVYPFRVVRPQ